jgi:hypothetical protein
MTATIIYTDGRTLPFSAQMLPRVRIGGRERLCDQLVDPW